MSVYAVCSNTVVCEHSDVDARNSCPLEEPQVLLTAEMNYYIIPIILISFIFMCMGIGTQGGCAHTSWCMQASEEVLDPLELRLQVVVSLTQ